MTPRLPPLEHSRPLRYATVFALYLMQGLPAGFALTAVANRLAADGVSPPAIGRFVALVGLPWTLQFVWGPLVDRYQGSPMGRRKPWVLGSQLLAFAASLGLLLVDDPAGDLALLSLAFLVHSVFASLQDTSVDALAITVTPPEDRVRTNAFMRGGMLAGHAAGAAVLAPVMRAAGFRAAALTLSLVLLALTAATCLVRERAGDRLLPGGRRGALGSTLGAPPGEPDPAAGGRPSTRAILAALARGLLDGQNLRLFGAVLAVYFAASVFIRTLSVHLVQELRWDDTALSVLTGTFGMGAAVLAILAVGAAAGRFGTRRLLLATTATIGAYLVAFGLLAPLWPRAGFTRAALVLWYTFDPGFSVTAMPALMAVCRRGVEGSQFTAYMALVNLSDVAGGFVSGHALTLLPAPAVVLLCGGVVLAAAAAVRRSPRLAGEHDRGAARDPVPAPPLQPAA